MFPIPTEPLQCTNECILEATRGGAEHRILDRNRSVSVLLSLTTLVTDLRIMNESDAH